MYETEGPRRLSPDLAKSVMIGLGVIWAALAISVAVLGAVLIDRDVAAVAAGITVFTVGAPLSVAVTGYLAGMRQATLIAVGLTTGGLIFGFLAWAALSGI